jgi:hypothetical protein
MAAPRTSHETLILDRLVAELGVIPDVTVSRGMGGTNRFELDGWALVGSQRFQFGDLRLEGSSATAVVEAESGGGVTNLAKYWPYLAAKPAKRFVLAHLFLVSSPRDYVSHIALWRYLVERMREDLARRAELEWGVHWEAQAFTYGAAFDSVPEVAAYLRAALG